MLALHVQAALQARVLVAVRAILAQHALAALQAHLALTGGAPGPDCMATAVEWHQCDRRPPSSLVCAPAEWQHYFGGACSSACAPPEWHHYFRRASSSSAPTWWHRCYGGACWVQRQTGVRDNPASPLGSDTIAEAYLGECSSRRAAAAEVLTEACTWTSAAAGVRLRLRVIGARQEAGEGAGFTNRRGRSSENCLAFQHERTLRLKKTRLCVFFFCKSTAT